MVILNKFRHFSNSSYITLSKLYHNENSDLLFSIFPMLILHQKAEEFYRFYPNLVLRLKPVFHLDTNPIYSPVPTTLQIIFN